MGEQERTRVHAEPSGEITVSVVVIRGQVRCVYVNDYRIAGSKPYVSERPQETISWKVREADLLASLPRHWRDACAQHELAERKRSQEGDG